MMAEVIRSSPMNSWHRASLGLAAADRRTVWAAGRLSHSERWFAYACRAGVGPGSLAVSMRR